MGNAHQRYGSPVVADDTTTFIRASNEFAGGSAEDEDYYTTYDKKIRLLMGDDVGEFQQFTRTVKSLKSKEILQSTAIVKLTTMMKQKYEDLVLGLNCHLSDGFKIEKLRNGQLCYRSPAQKDPVPLVVDTRAQQLMAELNEAKLKLQQTGGKQQEDLIKWSGSRKNNLDKQPISTSTTTNSTAGGHPDIEETSDKRLSMVRKTLQSIMSCTNCSICLEPMKETHVSPDCLHRFCGECFKTSLWYNKRCPTCRTHISSKRSLRQDKEHDTLVSME